MYRTILKEGVGDLTIKKSRFIGYAKPFQKEEEVINYINQLKQEHYGARHHCSAYILGAQGLIQRYDDDKEPSGTAGVPMLEVLKKEKLTNLCVVVVRYFGGTLLGTGGLVRAYTQGCKIALESAEIVDMIEYRKVLISYDYTHHGELEYAFRKNDYFIMNQNFLESVLVELAIAERDYFSFEKIINSVTGGKANVINDETLFYPEKNGVLVSGFIK